MTDSEFCEAFRTHKDALLRFAYRMTGTADAAEDVVQECFVVLWKRGDTFDGSRGTARAFLFGIARNLLLKRLRWEYRRAEWDVDDVAAEPWDIEGLERAEAVSRAVQALPPLQREVLILVEYEEMSLEETATATGAELAAVKSRLHRARKGLREMLAPYLETKGNTYETRR
ncbi:MAG: RNA polymerase sigma factor [Acidobacteriota bacterium]